MEDSSRGSNPAGNGLAVTKLEECQMWLAKCRPTKEALERDQAAPAIVPAFDVATGTFKEDSALD